MSSTVPVSIARIATANPPHDVHSAFIEYVCASLEAERTRRVLRYLVQRSGIAHRYSFIDGGNLSASDSINGYELFRPGQFPGTGQRMELFSSLAPSLLHSTLDRLNLDAHERRSIRHVIITCCTGLAAPGLDFETAEYLGLDPGVERTMVGFMGCYAAINGLRLARHIVRSQPDAAILMVNLELCSLHLQETRAMEKILSFLLFADGCAASLICAGGPGIAIDSFRAIEVAGTREMIQWRIGDSGFDMDLSTQVPAALQEWLSDPSCSFQPSRDLDLWAVHPGGRAILDAVQSGLGLDDGSLLASRTVLREFGNMSSATVMFVLQRIMQTAQAGQRGCAMSFGPGITAETMDFHVL